MYIKRLLGCLLIGCTFSWSCKQNKEVQPTLFELVDNTGIDFTNPVIDQEYDNSFLFRNFYNGGGVAIGDINNDGLADVLLTSNMEENKLYLNKGDFKFEDITAKSGMKQDSMWSTGAVMADINNDGWLDMYICNSGHMKSGHRRNKLYLNNHDLTFTEAAAKYGLAISAYTTQASFFDYDLDGDLDCFMIDNSPMPVNTLGYTNRRELPAKEWLVADFVKDGGDHLYRNDNGHYTEVNKEAGIHGTLMSFGLGVSVGDINNDGYPDIYVANDSYERDYLYVNQKNGTFKDEMEKCMKQNSFSSMGADIGDINNDGYADIFTTDMLPDNDYRLKTLGAFDNIDQYRNKVQIGFYHQYMKNCLQLNNGNGTFSDVANYSGVYATDWSWGALLFDADNDGLNDIYVCNGVNRDVTDLDFMEFFANDVIQKMVLTGKKEKVHEVLEHIPKTPVINKAFKNLGDLRFSDACNEWGFTQPSFSNGAAYADLDNDGDLDLVINNINQQAFIYKNKSRQQNANHYISILLKGKDRNTYAVGSRITVHAEGAIITRELVPSRGFQSSMDYKQVIGLGKAGAIDSMVIMWPDRTVTTFLKPAIDTTLILTQPAGVQRLLPDSVQNSAKLFTAAPQAFEKHVEDDYVDFYYERNIPELLSREGPKVATADVNGDGLADMYIGGTKGHPGQLYLQQKSGGFIKKAVPVFLQFKDIEDEAVLFFDCDKDGDADLFVGAGGNSNPPYSREMQCRLLKNDGKGNFTLDASALHTDGMNTGVAAAHDFDNDGDLDLFVGGRSTPRNYGVAPTSYLFVNNGNGQFTDMAKAKNPDMATIGMVTGAIWANVGGDEAKELIITGEWMAPRIFSYQGDRFTEVKNNLAELYGLWQTVVATDVNNDGRIDLVLGNIGDNFYLHPNKENPVKLWINDFNNNGSEDKILTRTAEKRDVPVFLKREMQEEIPTIKKENLKNKDYAKRSLQELFSKELIDKSSIKLFNYTSSCVAINNGNDSFTVQALPYQIQLSMMNAILCTDLNKDGFADIILGGNKMGFPPQFGKLDASYGEVLINNGKGGFRWLPSQQTGLLVDGEVRDITLITGPGSNYVLFARNDDYPVLYNLKK
jgi:enediyne biosynthesis protein E4